MLRIAYSIEFFLAIIAIFTFWSQVGGQAHLDLIPWYWKLIFSLSSSAVCLKLTAAATEKQSFWTRRTLRWMVVLLLLVAAAGAVTYYAHLNEPTDADDTEAVYSSSLVLKAPAFDKVMRKEPPYVSGSFSPVSDRLRIPHDRSNS